MKVYVRFLGFLTQTLGSSEITLELRDGASLEDLLNVITERGKEVKRALLDEEGGLPWNILVLINQREAGVLGGLKARLKDGDEVTVVPVSHGG